MINSNNFEEFYKKGIEAFKQHEFEEAIDLFDNTLEVNPKNVKAWLHLGEINF